MVQNGLIFLKHTYTCCFFQRIRVVIRSPIQNVASGFGNSIFRQGFSETSILECLLLIHIWYFSIHICLCMFSETFNPWIKEALNPKYGCSQNAHRSITNCPATKFCWWTWESQSKFNVIDYDLVLSPSSHYCPFLLWAPCHSASPSIGSRTTSLTHAYYNIQ